MKTENQFNLEALDVSQLPELVGFEQKQKDLVLENPFVEIIDNKTYEVACKSRTSLLKGRTSLEAQDKLIASKLTAFRRQVGEKTKQLIDITLVHEEKQQVEVKRYEAIKQAEKDAKDNAERLRVEKIKEELDVLETSNYRLIQSMTFESLKSVSERCNASFETDFDFEEYKIMFDQVKERIVKSLLEKTNDLIDRENQRVENEKLKAINEENERKNKELQDKIDADNLERENKAREEKSQQFEIRKNRLLELDVVLNGEFLERKDIGFSVLKDNVFNCSSLLFEDELNDIKSTIQLEKQKAEFELKKQAELKAENEAKEKAEIEHKKKIDLENKARVKRLSIDKKIIAESLETYFADLHLETENQETKDFIEVANTQIQELKSNLLTQLENI